VTVARDRYRYNQVMLLHYSSAIIAPYHPELLFWVNWLVWHMWAFGCFANFL